MRKTLFLIIALALFVAACGEDATPTASGGSETDSGGEDAADAPDAEEVVFIWAETGGCAMAGPNCARYEVTAAGDVATYREGEADVAATGTVDVGQVEEWLQILGSTDIDALIGRLGPGETKAAFDGVDHTLEAPQAGLNLSSVDVEFSSSEQVFKQASKLAGLAAEAAPLELKQR